MGFLIGGRGGGVSVTRVVLAGPEAGGRAGAEAGPGERVTGDRGSGLVG